jgi:hypothetical protein
VAKIRKACLDPLKHEGVHGVDSLLTVLGVLDLDRKVARELAFAEFYERIGKMYEAKAREKNGDLVEFKTAKESMEKKFGGKQNAS